MSRSPLLGALAGAVCAVLLAISTNVATSLVPAEWTHHHQPLVWASVAGLAILSVALAVIYRRERASPGAVIDQRIEAESISGPIILIEAGSTVVMGDVVGGSPPARADVGSPDRARAREPVLPFGPPFLNRTRETTELLGRIRAGEDSLLAIEGDRWVGKSATATAVVRSLLEDPAEGVFDPTKRRFVWLNANDRCPSLAEICGALALDTGEQALSAAPAHRKREALRAHLACSGTVLVLDNLRLIEDRRSRELIELLEDLPQHSLVIAAVNRRGTLVAPRVQLQDLDEEYVHDLIADRVQRFNVDGIEQFDEAFSRRLRALIGGNPGMIEWFLRGYRDSSDGLEQHIAAVEKGGELAVLFEPTWRALEGGQQAFLEACSYMRGEATAQQIAIACECPVGDVQTAAEDLRREGLITPQRRRERPTTFTCAKALQLFVAAEMPDSRRRIFTTRLADHYIGHFTASPEDAGYGSSEVGALRIVQEQLFELEDDGRIQALFWVVLDILFTLGQFDELIAAAELSYRSGERVQNFAGAALGALIKACTHAVRDERALALESFALGQLAAANSGLPGPLARAKRCRALLHYRAREPRQALGEIEGVTQLAQEGNDPSTIVDAFDLCTAANWYLGRLESCEAAAHGSLLAGEAIGWQRARAFPLRFLAELAIQRRQWPEAHELLAEAGEIAAQFGDRRQLARIDLTHARLGLLQGALGSADAAARRAVAETTRLGLPPEQEEAIALARAIKRAQRSSLWRRSYQLRRPRRLSGAPVGGD